MKYQEAVESRRAAQYFDTEKKVSEELLKQIYDLAKLAPSSFNIQPWRILLISSDSQKKKLQECAFNQPKVSQASHNLVFLGDTKAYEEMDWVIDDFISKGFFPETNREVVKGMAKNLYQGENERAFVSRNVGLLAMSIMNAAASLGVASHPMDGFDAASLRQSFNIPERYDIVMIVALGYRSDGKDYKPRGIRRDFEDAVIRETF